jgi:hypothetical protein
MTESISIKNFKAPDFTQITPPKKVEGYQLDCRDFKNRQALEKRIGRDRGASLAQIKFPETGLHYPAISFQYLCSGQR